jgi:hypothetical protein
MRILAVRKREGCEILEVLRVPGIASICVHNTNAYGVTLLSTAGYKPKNPLRLAAPVGITADLMGQANMAR